MNNNFDKELDEISRELLALKSESLKAPENLETVVENIQLSFDLELHNFGDGNVGRSKKMAVLLFNFGSSNPLLSVDYNISGLNSVDIRDVPYFDDVNGRIGRLIYVIDHNSSDITKLNNGQAVTLTYNIRVNCSSPIDYSLTYENLWVS